MNYNTDTDMVVAAPQISIAEVMPSDVDAESQAASLILLAKQITLGSEAPEFFHDADEVAFVTYPVGRRYETWAVNSKRYRRWLASLFYRRFKKPPQHQAINNAIGVLEAEAINDGPELKTFVRVAPGQSDTIYLDLCDADWQVVEITSDDWSIIGKSPVKFIRHPGMAALAFPERGGNIYELRKFINAPNDGLWKLIIAWLVASLNSSGPYPVLVLQGGQGTGKSLTTEILRSLVDNSSAMRRTLPTNSRDLLIAARNSWVLAFDNLSGLKNEISDDICRLATGGGSSTRQLYTDVDEIIIDVCRPVILNGIDDIATRPDLQERALILQVPQIQRDQRQTEKSIRREFDLVKGRIFGALLDIVSSALRELPHTSLAELPRMADFAVWITAAEKSLGWKPGEFMNVYSGNQKEAIEFTLQSDPFASALLDFLDEKEIWSGTATELLRDVSSSVDKKITESRFWPTSRNLKSKLMRLQAPLSAKQIEYEYGGHCGKGSSHIFKKVAQSSSRSSPLSLERRESPLSTINNNVHHDENDDVDDVLNLEETMELEI